MTAQTDPTPNSRRSPMEHERDLPDAAQTDAPERIWAQDAKPDECNFIGGGWWDDSCGNTQHPHIVEYVRVDLHDAAQAKLPRLGRQMDAQTDAPDHAEPKCEAGCKVFYGGERKHHKDCVFYPESLTKVWHDTEDELQAEIAKLREALGAVVDEYEDQPHGPKIYSIEAARSALSQKAQP
jgi:hypothetical protein